RRRRPSGGRPRPARSGGRRPVVEAAVLLLALTAWISVRVRQGVAPGGRVDPQLALLPTLLGLAVVVVLLRIHPLPVRRLLRWARGRASVVPLVALARAGRAATAGSLTLLVLVVALSQAVFGGLVAHTLQQGRAQTAAWRSGADAVLLGPGTVASARAELAGLPGVAGTAAVHTRVQDLVGGDGTVAPAAVLADVDPVALLEVAPASALGRAVREARLPAAARAVPEDAPVLDVLADPALLARHPDGLLDAGGGTDLLRLRIVGTLPEAARRDPVLGPLLGERPPGAPLLVSARTAPPPDGPGRSAVLLRLDGGGHLDEDEVRKAAARTGAAGSPVELRTLAAERALLEHDGLATALDRSVLTAGAGSLSIALLVVVLELALGARDRARTVSYLRTMGLGSGPAAVLQVVELLPLVVSAALGGTALGLLLPAALGPVLDLAAFGGGPQPDPSPDWALTAALGLGLVLLVASVAVLETLLGRRRRPGAVLRLGEAP
ncbi:hypothetical protein ACWEQL_24100, partial [Kitasatospora sp. NPDC004240]